ncbi:MAG: hypothetical protein B6U65_01955 [Candidatus Wolframiiraptor sp. EX4484-121]|nr:MAG: hypothetical protein B6U65_01955 [Candidatus Wolframiiraptor sp. EX4484-121]
MVSPHGLKRLLPALLTLLLLASTMVYVSAGEKPVVVATTSVIGSVVKDLAGDRVDLYIIVSPAICPAHHDVKPSDVYTFSKASLILYHGFEPWVKDLYKASGSKAKLVKISGPWNTPDGIKSYYEKVASTLKEELGIDVSDRLDEVLPKIDSLAEKLKSEAEKVGVSRVKVIAMKWVEGFVKWLGFEVVADFGPPEKLSSADVEKLVKTGKSEGVMLVISNLQSGVKFGESLAGEIGASHIILTNFPWTDPDLKTLMDVLERNAERLMKGVELYQVKSITTRLEGELNLYRVLSYCLIAVAAVEAIFLAYTLRRRVEH